MSEENKALVRRGVEAYNEHDLDAISEMLTTDFVYHGGRGNLGKQAYLQHLERETFATFPDVHVTIEDMVAEGDRVAVRYTFRGTHQGEGLFQDVAPTGKQVDWRLMAIWRIAGGKMAEGWIVADDVMQQLQS